MNKLSSWHTHENNSLHTLESTTINTLKDRVLGVLTSELGNVFIFCYPLGTTYDDFQEKLCMYFPCGNCQIYYCSNLTTIKSLTISTRNIHTDFS